MDRDGLIAHMQQRGLLHSDAVIAAFRTVPREAFVPEDLQEAAYEDRPLPLPGGQTISAPHIVAYMTELLDPGPGDTVLEIGTGSGYQAAILAQLVDHVYTTEVVDELVDQARDRLSPYENVTVIHTDGSMGDEEYAPYDKILYTAAAPEIPAPVFDQVREGGVLVAPVGRTTQRLKRYRKENGVVEEDLGGVRFVPLTGAGGV